MAGIGFELRKLLKSESFFGLLRAYGFAGTISSGPWLLSILSILAIGLVTSGRGKGPLSGQSQAVVHFQVSVTYVIAASLLLTGALQLQFTRFIADRLFEKQTDAVLPNLIGALTLTTLVSGGLGALCVGLLFHEDPVYRLLLLGSFVLLSDIWVLVVLLSGLRAYRVVLRGFAVGYGLTVAASLLLRPFGLLGLLLGFFLGHAVLFFSLLGLVLTYYPGCSLCSFDFLRRRMVVPRLALIGLVYNLAIWADKLLFWFNPATSSQIIGPLRASVIYDIPIFLSYLSIVPGMGVFLVRIETDFAEHYDAFYNAVREGDTLAHIRRYRDRMVLAVRQGIYEIFKVQGLTVVLLLLLGERLLHLLGISQLYAPLFYIDVAAAGVQVLLLAILNVTFYLDRRGTALFLSLLFCVSNIGLTLLTQHLGPTFYGYGFALSVVLTSLVGLGLLSYKLDRLEYETFMLQHHG